jgi:DNA-binding NarL/FixJ family response regulator
LDAPVYSPVTEPSDAASTRRVIGVLLVDDHEVVRIGLRQLIDSHEDLKVCGEATTISEARGAIELLKPDVVLLDLTLGEQSGFELLRSLGSLSHAAAVLVLSMFDESLYADDALALGARGYTMKDAAPDDLINAIRRVAAGGVYLSEHLAQRLMRRVANSTDRRPRTHEGLTSREQEVVSLLSNALSTREIAERLGTAVKTVDSHKRNICEKLGLESAAALLRYAIVSAKGGARDR